MAKDNSSSSGGSGNSDGSNSNNLSTPSSSTATGAKRAAFRSKPYDANNSLVRKVATKMTDLIPHRSWISKWFNSSQDETTLQPTNTDDPQYKAYDEKNLHPPPVKRPCIRMDVTHPPGTFTIKPRNRNLENVAETPKEHYSNYNETTQDFLEPSTTSPRLHRFVSSTPAFPMDTNKVPDPRSALNMLMSEQNNNGAANGMDDNSESSESTSGCSSLIPQNNRQEAPSNANYNSPFGNKRRYIDDKLNFTNHLQSPRSLFLDNTARETLSSRRPSFNALMMTNPLERSSSLSSPFYPGNTMFGGANAANLYRRSSSVLSEPPQYNLKAPKRTSVEVNPSSSSSTSDLSGMSHTARRILEALEQFSSPLSDAKKMPVKNIMGGSTQSSSPTSNRKRSRGDDTPSPRVGLRHLTRELTVPTVPDLLRIRRRQKLQNTTMNARKIMTSRTAAAPVPTSQDYHIRTEADIEPKRNSQLKAKKKMNLEKQETIESVNLPTIPLPISSLPRFDISLPQCTKPTKPASPDRQQQQAIFDKDESYKFASPIRLADTAKNVESINNFTFSKPITPSKMISTLTMNESYDLSKTLSVDSNDTLSCSSSFTNFIWTGPSQTLKAKEKEKDKEEEPKGPKVASELKTGSVMDFFAKKSSTSSDSSSTWECNECLIKNNEADKYCLACKSSKPANPDEIEILECSPSKKECKISSPVRGNSDSVKSSTKTADKATSPKIFDSSPFSSASTTTFNSTSAIFSGTNTKSEISNITTAGIDAKVALTTTTTTSPSTPVTVKPVKSSWECPCCMVRNLDNVGTCPCCNTAKPGTVNVSPKRVTTENNVHTVVGFGDKFKKPKGSWSCDMCMVQNNAEADKCVACETSRISTAPKTTTTITGNGFGDKFKKPTGFWTCDSCMIQNKPEVSKCIACESAKPGTETSSKPKLQFNVDMPASTSGFVFGIDKAGESTTAPPKTNGFTFGSGIVQPVVGGFSFGMPSNSKAEGADASKATPGFGLKVSETVAATATFQFGSKPTENKKTKETQQPSAAANFSFGIPTKNDVKVTSSGFVFSAATENKEEEKNEVKPASTQGFVFAPQTTQSKNNTIDSSESKTINEIPTPGKFMFGSSEPVTTTSAKEEIIPKQEEKIQAPVTEAPKQPVTTFAAPVEQPQPQPQPQPQSQPQQQQQQQQSLPSFSFGATSASTSTSPFTFSSQPKPADALLPAFGSAAAPKPTFSFGKTTETTNTPNIVLQQQPTNKPNSITFGRSAGPPSFPSQTNQTTPSLFSNMNATPSTASSSLGASNNKPLMFGATSDNKVASTFGESESKLPAFAAPNTGFGSPTNVFGGSSATPSFGAATTCGLFTTTKPSETASTNPSLFSFGQSSQSTAQSTSGFNFSAGSNASGANDQKNIFTFGASSSGTSSSAGVGGGGSTSNAGGGNSVQVGNGFGGSNSFSTTTPSFNFSTAPKPEAPVSATFGQATNAPIFSGSNAVAQSVASPPGYPGTATPTPSPATPFSFGSTSVPTSFSFGASPTPSTSGFNFNAPNNPATPVAFDPNVQPTFNFTAGSAPPAFNAPPTRKIKKAVRRMPRQ